MNNQRCNFSNRQGCNLMNNQSCNSRNNKGCCSNKILNGGFEQEVCPDNTIPFWNTGGEVFLTDVPFLVHTGCNAVLLQNDATLSQTVFRVCPNRQYQFSFFAKFGSIKELKEMERKNRRSSSDSNSCNSTNSRNTLWCMQADNDAQDNGDNNDNDNGKDKDKDDSKSKKFGRKSQRGKDFDDFVDDFGLRATVTAITRNSQIEIAELNIQPGSLSKEYTLYQDVTCVTPCDVVALVIRFEVMDGEMMEHVPEHFVVAIDDVALRRC